MQKVGATAASEKVHALVFAGYVFVSGTAFADKNDVKGEQATDGKNQQHNDDHQRYGCNAGRRYDGRQFENDDETTSKHGTHVQTEKCEELKKKSIVSFAHAVVQPRTVMIELIYARVAYATMRTSRWTIEITGLKHKH